MPRGYLWCEASPGASLEKRYYETHGRRLQWKTNKDDTACAGFYDLAHFCKDAEPIRSVGNATKRDGKELFRFEISGSSATHRLFTDSSQERSVWISGLQNTVLAVMLQNPTTSTEDELSGLQEKLIRSSSVNSTSSDDDGLSASGARTSVGLVLDGTKIASIVKGSPAAGDVRIEANDCIMTVDGQKVDKNSVLNLLRGTDELGSLVRLKLRKHGTLKTTYEAVLRRTEMRRIRDVAALYQLTEEMTKNPGKVLAQKVAEKVAAVEQHDRAMYIAALEHVDGLQVLLRRFSEERGNKYYQAGGVILDLQEWKDGVLSGDSFSTDATPRFFTPRSEPSPPPDQGWAEMERHEAEIAEANKSIKSLQRTIASLEQQVQEAEAKAAEMNRALQVALVDKETLARELIQAQDEASETQCRVQQERSLHESAHSTIRTSTTEEMHLLKEKNETIAQLEDEVSSLNRELDRMKDILQEAQDCAARDLAEMVGQQSELYQEQVEGMVSERENLKERIRVLDVENQNLQNAIAGLDRQIKELEDGQEQIISDAEERARVNFDSERAKLEEAMKNAQKKCTEQIHQMEQLVASVRMETAGELAEEKRLYAEAQKQLREAEYKCGVVAEKHENIMRVKQALEQDIIRLSSKADTASKKTSDTERLLFADAANHRRDVENLENENSRLRAEKRALEAQTDSIPSLQEEIERCRTEIARLDDDNTSLRSAMRQLDATVDVAQESLAEAERKRSEADAALGTSKDKITLLESENERLGSVERLLGLDLKEANLRLADAQAILKETMDMVEAPSPSALARIVASLVKEAGKVAEHEHFRQRAQDSESILNALSELLHAPDYQALPRLVTSLASQRLALSNAQIQLEEEVKALRSQLEGVKRQSQSEMVTKEDELRRISMALSQAESDRDRYEADLMFANKQLAAVAGSIPALEQELENQGHAHTMMHNKLGSITEERDGLIAQLQHTEHELSQLVLDKQRFAERNQLLEEQKIRLEKESLDNMEKLKRTAASNVQLRQQMEKYTVALEQHESSSNLVLDNLRQEYMKTRDDMERLREQRDVALQALDNLQNEAKQSNLRANSLSSNLDAVLYDLEDLRAQRNAAIHQVNQYRAESERMREIANAQQQQLATMQATVEDHARFKCLPSSEEETAVLPADKNHNHRGSASTQNPDAAAAAAAADAAHDREHRRAKELLSVAATIWDYSRKSKGRSYTEDPSPSSKDGKRESSKNGKNTAGTSSEYSSTSGSHRAEIGYRKSNRDIRDVNPRDSQFRDSSLFSTFTGIFGGTSV